VGLPISCVWEMARGLQTSLEAFEGAKQCLPMCPGPSTSPEESRDSPLESSVLASTKPRLLDTVLLPWAWSALDMLGFPLCC